ncbi:hypothetical protein [Azospirillum doebereinerae]
MSSIPALPSPSSAQSPTGLAKLRQMLASDAAAVQPIRRVPGEDERKRSEAQTKLDATDDALKGSGRAETEQTGTRSRAAGTSAGGFSIGGTATDSGPVTATAAAPSALPNAGFETQRIHQEIVGEGLHIEPWSDAIEAYRRADAGMNTPMLTQVAV